MKTIPIIKINGANTPSKPLPKDALKIVSDGVNYTVYEVGDTLPTPAPEMSEAERITAAAKIKALELLDASDRVILRALEDGNIPKAWKDYRAALREVVRMERATIPEQPPF